MTAPLPLLTEEEVRACRVGHEEAGYGCLTSPHGHLPLKEMTIDARVVSTFAQTTLRQVFVNTLGSPLEATYIFPVPQGATVSGFALWVNGRRQEGELLDAGHAPQEDQPERVTAIIERFLQPR